MMNPAVVALRLEYTALVAVSNGLLSIIRAGAACNLLTMARLAEEARSAARSVASQIERLSRGARSLADHVQGFFGAAVAKLVAVVQAMTLGA